jgi:hypothetical protein
MDLTSLVTPGAQSLVAAILSDSWVQVRSALSRRWTRDHHAGAAPEAPAIAVERAGRELDSARDQALALAGTGDAAQRGERMQLFLAGYLAGQLAARPELAEIIAELPSLLGSGTRGSSTATTVHNSFSGHARNVVQTGDIEGDLTIG